jgi:hypothetical protein
VVGAAQGLSRRIACALCAAACASAATFPGEALAQPMTATGACRDGVPNGMYELRTPDGKLRVAGAFAMARRTGTFLFWTPAGARIAVIPYEEDARSGTVATWYVRDRAATESSHRLEAPHAAGLRHGTSRSWYDSGRPRGEYDYEHGRLVDARGWTEAGVALSASAARAQAERDLRRDDSFLGSLERLVAGHRPRCS